MSAKWQRISIEQARQHPLYGVKGWLAAFAVGNMLGLLKEIATLNAEALKVGFTAGQIFALDIPGISFIKMGLTVEFASVAIIYWFLFSKRRNFRAVATVVMLCTYPIIFLIGIGSHVDGIAGELVIGLFSWAISCAVWITYLQRSERVRVTFENCVRAGVTSQANATEARNSSFTPAVVPPTIPTDRSNLVSAQVLKSQTGQSMHAANIVIQQAGFANDAPTPMPLSSSTEEDFWAAAMTEVETGQRRTGVWAKAH